MMWLREFFKNKTVLNLYFKSPDNTSVRVIFPRIITMYLLVRTEFSIDTIFSTWIVFYEYSRSIDSRGKKRSCLTPHYHFHTLHRHAGVS